MGEDAEIRTCEEIYTSGGMYMCMCVCECVCIHVDSAGKEQIIIEYTLRG